jgi:hypothetical protein
MPTSSPVCRLVPRKISPKDPPPSFLPSRYLPAIRMSRDILAARCRCCRRRCCCRRAPARCRCALPVLVQLLPRVRDPSNRYLQPNSTRTGESGPDERRERWEGPVSDRARLCGALGRPHQPCPADIRAWSAVRQPVTARHHPKPSPGPAAPASPLHAVLALALPLNSLSNMSMCPIIQYQGEKTSPGQGQRASESELRKQRAYVCTVMYWRVPGARGKCGRS